MLFVVVCCCLFVLGCWLLFNVGWYCLLLRSVGCRCLMLCVAACWYLVCVWLRVVVRCCVPLCVYAVVS